MEVDLQDLMLASERLAAMADVYESVIGRLRAATHSDASAFETDEVYQAWVALRDLYWTYTADTQDNLNATSVTLIHYINAVCEQDDENARDLYASVIAYNSELEISEEDFEAPIDPPLEVPDLNNPAQVIDVPSHESADRPEEG